MFGTIGPKTIASVVAGLALTGAIIWVWITIVDLRADNMKLTADNVSLTASLTQAAATNAADVKALADLKAAYVEQQSALANAQTQLAQDQIQTQTVVTKVIHAPPSDKACFAPALATAFGSLYPQAAADNSNAVQGGEGQGGPTVLKAMPGVANGATGFHRLQVTIGPKK